MQKPTPIPSPNTPLPQDPKQEKRDCLTCVGCLLVILFFAFGPSVLEILKDIPWTITKFKNTPQAYYEYMINNPNSSNSYEAKFRCESYFWEQTKKENTQQAYEKYVELYSSSKSDSLKEAKEKLEDIIWKKILAEEDIKSIRRYRKEYPQGKYIESANKLYDKYIANLEPVNIFTLIEDKKVQVTSVGIGISYSRIIIKSLTDSEFKIIIPAGSYLRAKGTYQNMIVTRPVNLLLNPGDTASLDVNTACCDMGRSIPNHKNSFTLVYAPDKPELMKLMPILAKKSGNKYGVEQAAVWIITDNANFDYLVRMSISFGGVSAGNIISSRDVLVAMKIIDDAGIDITQKKVWKSRSQILRANKNNQDQFYKWLENKTE